MGRDGKYRYMGAGFHKKAADYIELEQMKINEFIRKMEKKDLEMAESDNFKSMVFDLRINQADDVQVAIIKDENNDKYNSPNRQSHDFLDSKQLDILKQFEMTDQQFEELMRIKLAKKEQNLTKDRLECNNKKNESVADALYFEYRTI